MTNRKTTKRALFTSTLALLMCVAMLIGTTFAWFTDTATTSVNKVQAGTLDVELEMATAWDEDGAPTAWASAEGRTLNFVAADGRTSNILWEPGCEYKLPELRIVNKGNLALKYNIAITGINGDAKLDEVIDWTVANDDAVATAAEVETASRFDLESLYHLTAGQSHVLTISGHMLETAGNEYQGLSIDGISITVYATQDTVECDSITNEYDASAQLPDIWDSVTETVPTTTTQDENNNTVYHITNAAEFVWYVKNVVIGTATPRADTMSVVLDCDIDLGGATITRTGTPYQFSGHFDGQGHTVSNYTIKRTDGSLYTGLFGYMCNASVKNLTVKNATVQSNGAQVGAIVPSVNDNSTVENCHAINCTVIGEKKVGSVVGYSTSIVNNCTATDCNVYCAVAETHLSTGRDGVQRVQAGKVLGFDNNSTTNITDADANNVNVYFGVTPAAPTTTAELATELATPGAIVTLTAGKSYTLPSTVGAGAVIDGNGAKVSLPAPQGTDGYSRLNETENTTATFKNVVFENGTKPLWFKGSPTFINCTFNCQIADAHPAVGTMTFENCTFNARTHFAPESSSGVPTHNKFFEAKNCTFNGMLTVHGFEKVSLTSCSLKGNNWSQKNMVSYCPVVVDNCSFTTGIRLASGMNASDVTCTNGTVTVTWPSNTTGVVVGG